MAAVADSSHIRRFCLMHAGPAALSRLSDFSMLQAAHQGQHSTMLCMCLQAVSLTVLYSGLHVDCACRS